MTRYPRLDALRASRQREEAEIAAPHALAADRARTAAHAEREAREGLERILRSKMAPIVLEQVGREMGRGLHGEIMKALRSISSIAGETTIVVPTGMLMGADPDSIVSRTVDWWKRESVPKMSLAAFKGEQEIKSGMTVIDVRIPELRFRHAVSDHF